MKTGKERVLIVEDDEWLAGQYERLLLKSGYDCVISPHAPAAIIAIDDYKPDVIILDVLLTGGTAFALLNELQSYDDTSKIPVILSTNLADQLDPSKLESYGVKKILDKTTMQPDDIVTAVKGALI